MLMIQFIEWRYYETVQPCSTSFQNSLFIVSLPSCDFSRLRKAILQHVPRKSMWDGVHWRRRCSTKVAKPQFSVSPVNFCHKRGVPCTWLSLYISNTTNMYDLCFLTLFRKQLVQCGPVNDVKFLAHSFWPQYFCRGCGRWVAWLVL